VQIRYEKNISRRIGYVQKTPSVVDLMYGGRDELLNVNDIHSEIVRIRRLLCMSIHPEPPETEAVLSLRL
jgi:hypothetical protein